MPALHKTLIVACVKRSTNYTHRTQTQKIDETTERNIDYSQYTVEELAFASEHAPFRHKKDKGVGMQVKPNRG